MSGLREWFRYHSIRSHILVPMWHRVPERQRWTVVHHLNKSKRFAWCDLVDAALNPKDDADACDGHLPTFGRAKSCRTRCGWGLPHADHTTCTCYCGKFKIEAER